MNLIKPALLGLLLAASGSAYSMTNQQLVNYCQQASAVTSPANLPPSLSVAYNQCLAFTDGFIAGFMTGPAILEAENRITQADWPVCLPDGFSAKVLARDVVKYVRDGGEFDPKKSANTILARVVFSLYQC